MDIGYLGKGKGKRGKCNKGNLRQKLAMLKGLGKGKEGKSPHWNFHSKAKGKGAGGSSGTSGSGKGGNFGANASSSTSVSNQKGKGKGQASVCWNCGKAGHFSSSCPQNRVNALLEALWWTQETGGDTWIEERTSCDETSDGQREISALVDDLLEQTLWQSDWDPWRESDSTWNEPWQTTEGQQMPLTDTLGPVLALLSFRPRPKEDRLERLRLIHMDL